MSVDTTLLATGDRVALRRMRATDRAAFAALATESRAFLLPWVPGTDPAEDPEGTAWFDATYNAARDGRSEKLLIVTPEDGAILGVFNVNEIVRGAFQSAFLGYWIGAAYARQGLMGEALRTGLGWAFDTLELHRVEANIQPGNEASIALVRAAGFVQEGFSERYLKIGGVWCDHERWALTKEAWQG